MKITPLWAVLLGVAMVIFPGTLLAQDRADDFNILFIHHSVGAQWLDSSKGDLRDSLENPALNDYVFSVHDATYGDAIGDDTDVCQWVSKFENQMTEVLRFDRSVDVYYADPAEFNQIVMFKSCYPASDIESAGSPPGDPYSAEKTIWNYKAAFSSCAGIFEAYPHILWVPVTAPPRNRLETVYTPQTGLNACEFNDWLANDYVADYRARTGLNNIAVFDFFGVLANPSSDPNYPGALKTAYVKSGSDSHPNADGCRAGTAAFLPFINAAVAEWQEFQADRNSLTAATADQVYLYLAAGPQFAGRSYRIVGTRSGVFPGLEVCGRHLPLNRDTFTDRTLWNANGPSFPFFRSYLDANGESGAALRTFGPIATGLVGTQFHFAYVLSQPVDFASCAVPVTIVP
jgi:hypothetical protein